jgi:predicted alpha/beta superfamily hydrolase
MTVKLKNILRVFFTMTIVFFISCQNGGSKEELINYMSSAERESVVFSAVSENQKYYSEVADVAEYIQEMSVYDEELDSTYIIHITLPPDYDKDKSYPMYMMTDGIWRLSDHAELRPLMVNGEIEGIIMVSIGYNYGVNAEKTETRLVELVQKSDLFLNFITDNLAPYLGELYNINYKRSALMGHSLGGLFVYYAVFNHDKYKNEPFNHYVIASPSFFMTNNQSNWKYGDIEKDYFKSNKKLKKEIYLTVGDKEYGDILQNVNNFLQESKKYGITTLDYEIFDGTHSGYVKPMLRKSLLKFFNKGIRQ